MNINFRHTILFILGLISLISFKTFAVDINLIRFNNTVSYTSGSGVSVIINPTGIFNLDNHFILELSDVGGTWTSPKQLNDLTEFYIPVVNGTLPTSSVAGSYKLRVRSTNPTDTIESDNFNIVAGISISIPNFKSNLYNESNSQFTCLGVCSPSNNIFGQLNVGVGEQTATINEDDRTNYICNYSVLNNYKITLFNVSNNQTEILTVKSDGSFIVPDNLQIGSYIFEIESSKSSISSVYSNIFIFHGNSTGLNNLSAETVCMGSDVSWSVDNTVATGIGRNYLGSKYEINFGDGSPKEYYTHAELMQKGQITHTFNSVSCGTGTPGSPNQGYYIVQLKLFNKGVYNSGNNLNYCTNYYENGNGADKRVNTSKAPVADFSIIKKQCITLPISATNTTVLGQYGTSQCSNTPRYTWAYKKPSSTDFTTVPTSSSWISNNNLLIPLTELEHGCWQIRLRAQNAGSGCVSTTEKIDTISIEAIPVASFTSSSTSICSGSSISFTNTSNVTLLACQNPTYKWVISPSTGFQYLNNTSATTTDIQLKFTQAQSYSIHLEVTNSCKTATSPTTNILVSGDPTVTFNSSTVSTCADAPANYTLDFSSEYKPVYSSSPYAPSSYEWTVSGTGVTTSDFSFTGGTTSTSPYPKILLNAFKTYVFKVKVNGSCSGTNEATLTYTLKELPVITNVNLSQTICSSSSFADLTLTSSMIGTTFSWTVTKSSTITTLPPQGSGDIIPSATLTNSSNTTTGIVTYHITPANNGCTGVTKNFVINVNPTPVISNKTSTICSGSTFSVTPINGGTEIVPTGTTYAWSNPVSSPDGAITGGSAQAIAQTNISQTLVNTTNSAATLTYTITPSSGAGGSCVGNTFTVVVNVSPTPNIDNIPNQTVCNGFNTTIVNFTGNVSGSTYTWTNDKTSIGLASSGTVSIPAFKAINTGSSPITAIITVTPTANNCSGSSKNFTILVNPSPIIINQPQSSIVCIGNIPTKLSVSYANSTVAPQYQWYTNSTKDSLSGTPILGENSLEYNPTSTTVGTTYYYCVLTFPSGGCNSLISKIATVTVNPFATISTEPLVTQKICLGGVIAPLSVAYTGGSGTATYQWYSNTTNSSTGGTQINGATSASYNPPAFNAVGTYYFYVIVSLNASGCGSATSQTAEVIVLQDPVVTAQPLATQTICQSTVPANLSVTASGGEGSYSYQWYSNSTNSVAGGTAIPTAINAIFTPPTDVVGSKYYYCLTFQTGLGCNATSTIAEVKVNPAPTFITQPQSSSICIGGTANQLSVSYANGTGTASYQWYSNNANSNTGGIPINSANNANYDPETANIGSVYYYCIITLTGGGCASITSNIANVTINALPTISTQPLTTQKICLGGVIAPLSVAYTGGSGTATYQWYSNTTNSSTGGTQINGATSASYNPPAFNAVETYYFYVIVSLNASGCGSATSQTAEVIVSPDPVVTTQPLNTQSVCQSTTPADLSVIAVGGEGTYSYQWYSNTTNSVVGGAAILAAINATFTPLTDVVGTKYYYCLISQTGLGCAVTSSIAKVIVNPAPTFTSQPQSSSVCINGTAIQLKVAYTNGTGTASYQWYSNNTNNDTGGNQVAGATFATYDPETSTVGSVYYYCIITLTGGGCSNITSNKAIVTVNALPTISIQPLTTQKICLGGTIAPFMVAYTGGSGTATYQWYSNTINSNTGGTQILGATSSSYPPPAFNTVGTYYFYVIVSLNASGCGSATSQTAEVIVLADPVVTSPDLAIQTVCQSTTPTDLSVTVTGGEGTYSYQWYSNTTSSILGGIVITAAKNAVFTPPTDVVGTKYYFCLISQTGLGCAVTSSIAKVTVNPAPTFTSQPQSSSVCINGTAIQLNVTYKDGVGTPQYQWYSNNTNSYTGGLAIADGKNATYNPPTTNLNTIYYYCVLTFPTGGCSNITSNIAAVTVNPYPVISEYSVRIGSDQTFKIIPDNLNGDIVPVGTTYTWSSPVINPINSITGASLQNNPQTFISQTLTNLTRVTATVTYTVIPTSGACIGTNFKIVVTVYPTIKPNIIQKNIDCYGANNGSLQTAIEGGIPFSSGEPYLISWIGPKGFSSTATSVSNLAPGDYNLKIMDDGGLPFSTNYTITEPADIIIKTVTNKNVSCFGAANGEIAISVSGGTLPYKYTWTKDANPFTGFEAISNLSPGNYTVSVTDANNCGPKITSFTITEPTAIVITLINQINLNCFGDTNGAISINVEGGVPVEKTPGVLEYNYFWSGPNGYTSNDKNLTNIAAGIYQLLVTDSTGCTQNFTVTVTQPDEVKINVITTPVTCYGSNNASIKLDITGGIPPYQIQWSNLGKDILQDNLSPGTYNVIVTDANACQKTIEINISEADFYIQSVVKNISCFGGNNGSINLNIHGGIAPISLVWSDNSSAGVTRNNLAPGTYTATISDASSCSFTKVFTIIEPLELKLSAQITNAFGCNNPNSGAIELTISGGTQPYSYAWSNGKTTKNLSNIPAGTYIVNINDSNGCTISQNYEVIRQEPITLSVITTPEFNCETKILKEICTAEAVGGVPPYLFTWSSGTAKGLSNEIMETTQSGIIVLGVSDGLGCTANYTFNLSMSNPGIDYQLLNCDASILGFKAIIPIGLVSDYLFLWDFGDGTTDTSQNPEHTFSTPGTYKVILTLKNLICTSIFEKVIIVEAAPYLVLDKLPIFCVGDSLVLHVSGANTYRWYNGSVNDSIIIKQIGDYSVLGISKAGCNSTLNFKATNFDTYNYTIQSDRDEITTDNPTLDLWSESINYSNYFWDFGDGKYAEGNNQNHTFENLRDGYFDVKLRVRNPNGCDEFATKRIWIKNNSKDNVFTPNGDGVDDVFMKGFHIQVFNRNGILLYDGTDGWDGTYKGQKVTNGTYFIIEYTSTVTGIKTSSRFVMVVR